MNEITNISHSTSYQYDFEELINPISLDEFVNRYWEKEDLVIKRNNSTFYKDILSLDLVDTIIDQHRQTGDNFRVTKRNEPIPPYQYLNADGSYNLNKLYAFYADGYSMVLRRIDQFWLPIKELCHNLRQTISHNVKVNMYLTPPNSVAYLPHTDAHDVLILQISGTKHWKLYDTLYETPLVDSLQPILNKDMISNPREVTMEAGDLMYIPRGVPHHAYTLDESSLHLTIGIFPVQMIDFITKSIEVQAYQNNALRKALPFGYLNDNISLQNVLSTMDWEKIGTQIDGEMTQSQVLPILENELGLQQRLLPNKHFKALDAISTISLKTKFKKRKFISCKVQHITPYCRIIYNGNTIKGPIKIVPVFEFIRDLNGVFLLQDLPIENDNHKVKLAARMVRGGLLSIVE
jgi:hypothetical protein